MPGGRYLIPRIEEPRVRRAADLTGVVGGLILFTWGLLSYQRVPSVGASAAEIVAWVPDWLTGSLRVLYAVALIYMAGLVVAILTQWRTRLDAVRDIALAIAASVVVVSVVVRWVTGTWPRYLIELGLADPLAQYPIFRVALVTTTLLVVAPHLTRPLRRLGWAVILIAGASGVGLGLGLPSSAVGAVGLGIASSNLILLAFGSPRGYPDVESISSALAELGVMVSNVRLDQDQSWGVRRLSADSADHGHVEIKAYGRDATDSQLFARVWRYVWYRESDASLALTRMQSVEHEALMTMMAEQAGASVPHVLTAGMAGDDMALLAVSRSGEPMLTADRSLLSDQDLIALWRSVERFHRAGISHGALKASAITIAPGGHQVGDFGAGSLASPEGRRALDIVELLVSLAGLVGVERAVRSAQQGLGNDRLGRALPFVQLPAVSRRLKRSIEDPKTLVSEVRQSVADMTGAELEETVQLRRVQPKNLAMTAVTFVAVYFLITQLSGIDFGAVSDVLQTADWSWIIVAFFVGQSVYLPEATAMLAAVGYPIPLRPVVVLQSAARFISLAVPSSAGRIAMTASFLRAYGVSFTASVVQGSIDTISGLIVEVLILLLALLTGNLDLGLDAGEREWGPILLVVVVVAVGLALLVRRVKRLRDWVMPVVGQAFGALRQVLQDPRRAFGLLASNFASRFVLALAMWFILIALDAQLGIWLTLTATVATGLLGGVVPIPGGVGVSETALTAFLVLFGVEETTAFAAAVIYRVATFYLPSGAGFLSMRWLDKRGYI